jgi:hypothetical protein
MVVWQGCCEHVMLLYLFPTEHISRQWVLTRQDAVREDLLELFALHCIVCWKFGKLVVYALLDIAMFGNFGISRKEACYSRLTLVPSLSPM